MRTCDMVADVVVTVRLHTSALVADTLLPKLNDVFSSTMGGHVHFSLWTHPGGVISFSAGFRTTVPYGPNDLTNDLFAMLNTCTSGYDVIEKVVHMTPKEFIFKEEES